MYNDVYVKTLQKGKDGATWYNGTVSEAITTDDPYSYETATDSSGNIIFAATGDYLFDTDHNTFYLWTGSKWKFISSIGTGDQLADSAVSTAKIRNGAVTTAKLDDGAVTTDKLNDGATTTEKLDDGAVTPTKLHLDGELASLSNLNNLDIPLLNQNGDAIPYAKPNDLAAHYLGTADVTGLGASTVKGAISVLNALLNNNNAGIHNAIYRGNSLGTSVTNDQWTAIKNGTFDNMFIGDYWNINGRSYRIAAFDYYCGKRLSVTVHHVVITVDSIMGETLAIAANNTGGYYGSTIHTDTLASVADGSIRKRLNDAFGAAHILSHNVNLSSTVADGVVTALTSVSTDLLIPTAGNVFGRSVQNINTSDGTPYLGDLDEDQFPLFMYNKSLQTVTNNNAYWLRDPVGARFAAVFSTGLIRALSPTNDDYAGVRPVFCIYQA